MVVAVEAFDLVKPILHGGLGIGFSGGGGLVALAVGLRLVRQLELLVARNQVLLLLLAGNRRRLVTLLQLGLVTLVQLEAHEPLIEEPGDDGAGQEGEPDDDDVGHVVVVVVLVRLVNQLFHNSENRIN